MSSCRREAFGSERRAAQLCRIQCLSDSLRARMTDLVPRGILVVRFCRKLRAMGRSAQRVSRQRPLDVAARTGNSFCVPWKYCGASENWLADSRIGRGSLVLGSCRNSNLFGRGRISTSVGNLPITSGSQFRTLQGPVVLSPPPQTRCQGNLTI